MKKIVRLNENDIKRIVKKTILKEDTYQFRLGYSNNLKRIEANYSGDEDRLDDIIDVYQNHIQQLKNIKSEKNESEKD
jgi:hypothetical protein|tara:strand:+ start:303 stop:536 length:234 start_codon:yes stop_codon:yes gene_type:complete